jgi:hypothetical protein
MEHIGTIVELLISPAVLVAAAVLALSVMTGLAPRLWLLFEDVAARRHRAAPVSATGCCVTAS